MMYLQESYKVIFDFRLKPMRHTMALITRFLTPPFPEIFGLKSCLDTSIVSLLLELKAKSRGLPALEQKNFEESH